MQADIVVAGGGCVGTLAAALCARAGWRVVLATPQPALPTWDVDAPLAARVVALAPQIAAALAAQQMPAAPWSARACPVRGMDVAVPGSGRVVFRADDVGRSEMAQIVEVAALQSALESWAVSLRVRRIADAVQRVDGASVELESGARIGAKLILACDGAESGLRRAAAVNVARCDYAQRAIVARLRCARPHAEWARQTMSAEGVLGALPLADGSISIVWSLPEASAPHWLAVSAEEFAAGVHLALGDAWGEMTVLGQRHSFALRETHAETLVDGRLCLLGDAAHTVHPLAGLGLNLGLADALSLVAALIGGQARGRPLDDPAVLARWSRERVATVTPYRQFIGALAGLGQTHTLAWRGVGAGFAAVDSLPALKRRFMQHAIQGSLASG